jgi:ADP-ribosyl-[dinitrogen reductase] hydrolase
LHSAVNAFLSFYPLLLFKVFQKMKNPVTKNKIILGAIIGDVVGSVYEWHNIKSVDFPMFSKESFFTDDSVLTVATMECLMENSGYAAVYKKYGRQYPGRGYGLRFDNWLRTDVQKPYNSWGNGSAMRVSPIGWAFNTLDEVLDNARKSAEVTHNHPDGIKGAQAVAAVVFLARNGKTKTEIRQYVEKAFDYDLERTIDEIRLVYQFDESCQKTVPEAITAFLESNDFEHAIRLAISIGGDSDTVACITGGIAEAFYNEIPEYIIDNTIQLLPDVILDTIDRFSARYR